MLNALLTGVASDSFHGLMKSLVDRIIEFKTKDTDESIEQRVRARLMPGSSYDASWHRLRSEDCPLTHPTNADRRALGLTNHKTYTLELSTFHLLTHDFLRPRRLGFEEVNQWAQTAITRCPRITVCASRERRAGKFRSSSPWI